MRAEALALRDTLGATALVEQLAGQHPTATLVAIAARLEQLDDGALRRSYAQAEGLGATLAGLGPEDLEGIDLEVRHESLERARAQLWRIWLVTSRAIGQRLGSVDATPGRPRADSTAPTLRLAASTFGLSDYRARQLIALAELEAETFEQTREAGLAELDRGKLPTLAKLLRAARNGGVPEADEWSTSPTEIVAVRRTFGPRGIGTDVASHFAAQAALVQADRYFALEAPTMGDRERAWAAVHRITPEQWAAARAAFAGVDALAEGRDWYHAPNPTLFGNVPYSRGLVARFVARLRETRERHPDLAWQWLANMDPAKDDQQELGGAGLHCQPARRIAFLGLDGRPTSGNQYAQVIFAGGAIDREAFAREWAPIGRVYQPAEPAVSLAHVQRLGQAGALDEGQIRETMAALGGHKRKPKKI